MRTLSAWGLVAIGVLGCGGPQEAGDNGAVCFRDDECGYGLVCAIPEGQTAAVCTADVSGRVTLVEVPQGVGGVPGAGGREN